jgi:hypothetical protein
MLSAGLALTRIHLSPCIQDKNANGVLAWAWIGIGLHILPLSKVDNSHAHALRIPARAGYSVCSSNNGRVSASKHLPVLGERCLLQALGTAGIPALHAFCPAYSKGSSLPEPARAYYMA